MPEKKRTIALINGTGRQAASVIRTVAAVGYTVRAQVHSLEGLVAEELADLPNVTLLEGSLLDNPVLIDTLFEGATIAFINTISQAGDEVKIGKALASAAKKRNVQHFIYSSMPDHSIHHSEWPSLPMWSCKFTVENYIRQLELPATFVYAGIYNNNFTSLPYPLFCMDFKKDESLEWRAPFHPETKLPWLDAEHDVGPAVLQLFKDGPGRWNGHRIALAFENLTPVQVCQAFSKALGRQCRYVFDKHIEIRVAVPTGYREQLAGIEQLFGHYNAPYLPGPEFEYPNIGAGSGSDKVSVRRDSSSESKTGKKTKGTIHVVKKGSHHDDEHTINGGSRRSVSKPTKITDEARDLWAVYRGIEEYAREVFPVEEEANGKTWMSNKVVST